MADFVIIPYEDINLGAECWVHFGKDIYVQGKVSRFTFDRRGNRVVIVRSVFNDNIDISVPPHMLWKPLHNKVDYAGMKLTEEAINYKKLDELNTYFMQKQFYNICFGKKYVYPDVKDVKFSGPATTVFFNDNTKITVKKTENDYNDPEKAFLVAYFMKLTGMTRTKCSKYLKEISYTYLDDMLEEAKRKNKKGKKDEKQ